MDYLCKWTISTIRGFWVRENNFWWRLSWKVSLKKVELMLDYLDADSRGFTDEEFMLEGKNFKVVTLLAKSLDAIKFYTRFQKDLKIYLNYYIMWVIPRVGNAVPFGQKLKIF